MPPCLICVSVDAVPELQRYGSRSIRACGNVDAKVCVAEPNVLRARAVGGRSRGQERGRGRDGKSEETDEEETVAVHVAQVSWGFGQVSRSAGLDYIARWGCQREGQRGTLKEGPRCEEGAW